MTARYTLIQVCATTRSLSRLPLTAPTRGCLPAQPTRADSLIAPHHTIEPTIHYEDWVHELQNPTQAKAR